MFKRLKADFADRLPEIEQNLRARLRSTRSSSSEPSTRIYRAVQGIARTTDPRKALKKLHALASRERQRRGVYAK